ncbi:MAG: PH domain-containing protein [Verrucomicrobia bacterium]|nr:PH domain-containing protein [Verrucomicrobiota bacterium]
MFDALRRLTLRLLRVPAEPQPPAGAPGSVKVFRAGARYFHLKVLGWAIAQLFALGGVLVSLWLVGWAIESARRAKRDEAAATTAIRLAPPRVRSEALDGPGGTLLPADLARPPAAKAKPPAKRPNRSGARQLALRTPEWVLVAIQVFEYGAAGAFLFQVLWTFAALRLDYEMRWYVVTDRSLRIRSGLLTVQESTLSFVNIQHVVVTQGPLQRLLGLADVRVQSAGGGGGDTHGKGGGGDTLHTAVFHAVDNAHEVRDLILARLRQFRAAGLGDPDDAMAGHNPPAAAATGDVLAAARELLDEARALRRAL